MKKVFQTMNFPPAQISHEETTWQHDEAPAEQISLDMTRRSLSTRACKGLSISLPAPNHPLFLATLDLRTLSSGSATAWDLSRELNGLVLPTGKATLAEKTLIITNTSGAGAHKHTP